MDHKRAMDVFNQAQAVAPQGCQTRTHGAQQTNKKRKRQKILMIADLKTKLSTRYDGACHPAVSVAVNLSANKKKDNHFSTKITREVGGAARYEKKTSET